MSSSQKSNKENKLSDTCKGWKPNTNDAYQIQKQIKEQQKLKKTQQKLKKTQQTLKTVFKRHPNDPHTKLYPTIEDKNDYLECTEAQFAAYRFDYNNMDKATQYLLENGYVVLKNVLNPSEIEKGKSLFWNFVSKKSIGWHRNDYKTWNIYHIGGELQNGLIWGKGMGQSKFQWFGRRHPKVLNIFAKLWSHKSFPKNQNIINNIDEDNEDNKINDHEIIDPNTDLLTSFDGIGLFTPWHLTNEYDKTNSGWYHLDQNVAKKPGIHTIQGYISYYDENESTGSTVFIPKTHLQVRKTLKLNARMGDFVPIRKSCKLLDSSLYKKILLCCDAGDMVLWDSRTIHCSSPALLSMDEMRDIHLNKNKNKNKNKTHKRDRKHGVLIDLLDELIDIFAIEENENEIDLLRLVGMVCMVPKWRLNNKNVLRNRIKAYINKCTLSHWPTEYCVLNYPSTVGTNQIEQADDLTKSLIGYV